MIMIMQTRFIARYVVKMRRNQKIPQWKSILTKVLCVKLVLKIRK